MRVKHDNGTWSAPLVGVVYFVNLDDCCVNAHFTARLVEIQEDPEYGEVLWFDNGVTLSQGGLLEEIRTGRR